MKARTEKELGKLEMTLTGTLIEDLMAAVERAEQAASFNTMLSTDGTGTAVSRMDSASNQFAAENSLLEPWFTKTHDNREYDPQFLGVA